MRKNYWGGEKMEEEGERKTNNRREKEEGLEGRKRSCEGRE